MNYGEVLQYLYGRLPMFHRIGAAAFKKDLTNTLKLCDFLNRPQDQFRSVHIAGTNGKGSTSHMLAAVMQQAGYKTGLYTSPHLKDFTERIKINGVPVSQEEVIAFTERLMPEIERIDPSFFELTVAMAFDHFSRHRVDVAIIETGLGGRFDSTNVITPVLSLITNISYDHQDLLGNTLGEIAFEKAGIIKPGIDAVIGERHPESDPVFVKKSEDVKAPLYFAGDHFQVLEKKPGDHLIEYLCRNLGTGETSYLPSDLLGEYQAKNIPGVLMAIERMGNYEYKISPAAIQSGLSQTQTLTGLRGRWQVLSADPLIICDVGHNEAGIRWVVEQLLRHQGGKLHIIFGMVRDKKPEPILRLLPANALYYFCQARIPRAREAQGLADEAEKFGLKGVVIPDVNEALNRALSKYRKGDLIFIGGSTFVVAEINRLT